MNLTAFVTPRAGPQQSPRGREISEIIPIYLLLNIPMYIHYFAHTLLYTEDNRHFGFSVSCFWGKWLRQRTPPPFFFLLPFSSFLSLSLSFFYFLFFP
ncbi:hypothetical protein SODALDRAFT_195283 [Sodiomyces alkalinus F11]|uniref:Uncharacterized protein n=1 Tax=Sodiomyces alkalinus (strain CBS 110278 / VKM F-3762 / F11) TaxID=1314773 RepID=A0A3N2PSS3_SODAK|nr:hypothetical protein SODALDRAFT_195283 [Sodiomyces alkalinus F11]ROT37376.1 hypothetical protein SODALDRAFT_195283 [Sodiomyces alkalinus F11]